MRSRWTSTDSGQSNWPPFRHRPTQIDAGASSSDPGSELDSELDLEDEHKLFEQLFMNTEFWRRHSMKRRPWDLASLRPRPGSKPPMPPRPGA